MKVAILNFPPKFGKSAAAIALLLGKSVVDVVEDSLEITIIGGEDKDLDKMWSVGIQAVVRRNGDFVERIPSLTSIVQGKRGGH